jgi:hypothetical protein
MRVVLALLLVGVGAGTTGCLGSDRHAHERAVIAAAKEATGFRQYAALFPSIAAERACEVRAGPPSHVFRGSCRTAVSVRKDGSAIVTFTQSIDGRHTWIVSVSSALRAQLVRAFGAPLVELIS